MLVLLAKVGGMGRRLPRPYFLMRTSGTALGVLRAKEKISYFREKQNRGEVCDVLYIKWFQSYIASLSKNHRRYAGDRLHFKNREVCACYTEVEQPKLRSVPRRPNNVLLLIIPSGSDIELDLQTRKTYAHSCTNSKLHTVKLPSVLWG